MSADRCDTCNHGPAALVVSRRHLGLLLYGKTWTKQGLLCAEHGRAQLINDLIFTAALGWWGVLSFFWTLGIIPTQISALGKHKQTLATLAAQTERPVA